MNNPSCSPVSTTSGAQHFACCRNWAPRVVEGVTCVLSVALLTLIAPKTASAKETSLLCQLNYSAPGNDYTLGDRVSLIVATDDSSDQVSRVVASFGIASNEKGFHVSENIDGTVWAYINPKAGYEMKEEGGRTIGLRMDRGNYQYFLSLNRITGELRDHWFKGRSRRDLN